MLSQVEQKNSEIEKTEKADEVIQKLTVQQAIVQMIMAVLTCVLSGSVVVFTAITGMMIAVGEPIITSGIILGTFLMICALLLIPVVMYFYNTHIDNLGMNIRNRRLFILTMIMFAVSIAVEEFLWIWNL